MEGVVKQLWYHFGDFSFGNVIFDQSISQNLKVMAGMYAFFSIKSFWKKGLKAVMFNVESSEIVETAKVSNYERDSLIFEPTAIVAKNIKTEPCANLSFASRMKNKVVDLLVQVKK